MLLSRISDPNSFIVSGTARQLTNNTNLAGGRLTFQVGDFVKMGGTFVNAHHSYTRAEAFSDDLFKGDLLGAKRGPWALSTCAFATVLEDGSGGGALFASDILGKIWRDGRREARNRFRLLSKAAFSAAATYRPTAAGKSCSHLISLTRPIRVLTPAKFAA